MTSDPPIGAAESQHLEFKQALALERPHRIGRAVVAMLNAADGEVWIGLREEEGRAVARDPVRDPNAAKRDLMNHLVDTIEPSLAPGEVDVDVVGPAQASVLRVTVKPTEARRPYAQIRNGGRFFFLRVADRIRTMDRQEIAASFGGARIEATLVEQKVREVRGRCDEVRGRHKGLWLGLMPALEQSLELNERYGGRLSIPKNTGNRPQGWGFSGSFTEVGTVQGGIRFTRGGSIHTTVLETGSIELTTDIESLAHQGAGEIYPYALLEYPTSVMRLMRTVLEGNGAARPSEIVAGFGLFGISGFLLRPYSPSEVGYQIEHPGFPHRRFEEGQDLIVEPPMVFAWSDVVETPDRCAFRLIKKVYAAFGYDEQCVPRVFDRERGLLAFSE